MPTASLTQAAIAVCEARLRIETIPDGALVMLDDLSPMPAPLEVTVLAGAHRVRAVAEGWTEVDNSLELVCDERRIVMLTLEDKTPPSLELAPLPQQVDIRDGVKIVAAARDTSGIRSMMLYVDREPIIETLEGALRHNLDTRLLAAGEHIVTVSAIDNAGNRAEVEALLLLTAPEPTLEPSRTATPPVTMTKTPTPNPSPAAPTATPQPTVAPVSVAWGEITIEAYGYEQALYTDPDRVGHPYPLLNRDRMGPPRARLFQTIVMRNEYLELTLIPELGGRLYSMRFLPTGQELLYQNRNLKPTHWGPSDQGWWLAAGGIEWCLPVEEHGYVTAEPWEPSIITHADGSATVAMSIQERSRNLLVSVEITLKPREAAIHLRPNVRNPDDQAKSLQFWINAMLSPGNHGIGPSLRFYYPASQVIVHSRGDASLPGAGGALAWPIYQGRDLSAYANWRDWLGFFAPELQASFTAIYDEQAQLGLVRAFPREVARGAKLFAFGLGFGENAAFSDDGAQYAEMWGGWTPTFGDDATLASHGQIAWDETWYVVSRCGGVTHATAQVAIFAQRDSEGIALTVAAPEERRWLLSIMQGEREIAREAFSTRPQAPFEKHVAISPGNSSEILYVRILNTRGEIVTSFTP